tara:strand:- start:278 stop:1030 length:753 start_codon:yes stop_codon:yes gene_type:complete
MHKPLTKTQIAIVNGQSIFQYKVKSVSDGMGKTEKAIKPSTNKKLGKVVKKGWLRGAKIYTLTLEERKTCPSSCHHWKTCFGNNMHLATRYIVDDSLMVEIENNLAEYSAKGKPFLVRLHILGDFPNVEYVSFWARMLDQYPLLNVYGYSAHQLDTLVGDNLEDIRQEYGLRFMVRISGDFRSKELTALSFDNPKALPMVQAKEAFVCPTQITTKGEYKLASKNETTLTPDCGTCGLCWTVDKPVVFLTH